MGEIKKRKKAIRVYEEAEEGEWTTLSGSKAQKVVEARANPVRQAILRILNLGPVRKSDLARYVHKWLGKKYSRSLVQYHLKKLEEAGLVDSMMDPEASSRAKFAYLKSKARVQVKPEPEPEEITPIPEELIRRELKDIKE